jgi:hypothetical protein
MKIAGDLVDAQVQKIQLDNLATGIEEGLDGFAHSFLQAAEASELEAVRQFPLRYVLLMIEYAFFPPEFSKLVDD